MFWWIIIIIGALLLAGGLISTIADTPRRVSRKFKNRIVISFYGPASAGKSSGIKALYNINPESIHPIPGTTKEVDVWELPNGLSVADTPGLQDTNEKLVAKAKRFIDDTDVFIYIINSNGGITEKVQADLELLKAIGRPLLVVLNKIDTIEKSKVDEFIAHQFRVAGVSQDNFLSVAFDPLPEISKIPINVKSVKLWIDKILKEKRGELLEEKSNAEII